MFVQEDTRILTTMFYRSVLLGFLINIVKVAQTESKSRKNMSPSQAVMKMGTGMVSNFSFFHEYLCYIGKYKNIQDRIKKKMLKVEIALYISLFLENRIYSFRFRPRSGIKSSTLRYIEQSSDL